MNEPNGSGDAATFFRYRDGQGRLVIVDAASKVPSSARGSVERISLAPRETSLGLPRDFELHGPSFAIGLASAALVGLVLLGTRRRSKLLRLALMLGVAALLGGAYLGLSRRLAGQSGALLATPDALIQDARDAVEQMNARTREQQRVLQELERER